MPFSRKKSCEPCRIAKTRCSRLLPRCNRCDERNLDCKYYKDIPKFTTLPRAEETLDSIMPEVAFCENIVLARADRVQSANRERNRQIDSIPTEELLPQFPDHLGISSLTDVRTEINSPWTGSSGLPENFVSFSDFLLQSRQQDESSAAKATALNNISAVVEAQAFRENSVPFSFPNNLLEFGDTISEFNEEINSGERILSAMEPSTLVIDGFHEGQVFFAQPKLLTTRYVPDINAYLVAKLLLGQLSTYPRILIQGMELPPFIYPNCDRSAVRSECAANEVHHCLPEPLAICASLTHMFYARTAASSAFVWKMIYAEQQRLYLQACRFSRQDCLAALQATIIYVILQSQDRQSIEINSVCDLILTMGKFAVEVNSYRCDLDLNKRNYVPCHRDWVFWESIKRTTGLLYVIELLLEVVVCPEGKPRRDEGFREVPLPCERALWNDGLTIREWERRYKQSMLKRKLHRSLVMGDLMRVRVNKRNTSTVQDLAHQDDKVNLGEEQDSIEDIANWCEGADHYGNLIWTAIQLSSNART